MAARPYAVSRVRLFVNTLTRWVKVPGDTTIDMPFIIAGCTERTVIFDLRFHMEVPDDDPVLLRNDVIGRRLRWDGVEDAIATRNQRAEDQEAKPHLPRWPAQSERLDDDEALSSFSLESNATRKERPRSGQKREVDWTAALEDVAHKRRRGGDPL